MAIDVVSPTSSGTLNPNDTIQFNWVNPALDGNGNPTTLTGHQLLWKKNSSLTGVDDPDQETPVDIAGNLETLTLPDVTALVDGASSVYFSLRSFNDAGGNNGTDQLFVTVGSVPAEATSFTIVINP